MSPSSVTFKLTALVMIGLGLTFGAVWALLPMAPVNAAPADGPTLRPQTAGIVTTCDEASLRVALADGGTVTFDCSGIITITSSLFITAPTLIDGSGQSVTLSGGNAVRIIDTTSSVGTLAMQNITLTNGFVAGTGQSGGALRVLGDLILTHTTVISNFAAGNGGGAFVTGTLTLASTQFIGNTAADATGGGGEAYANRAVSVDDGMFQNNACSGATCNGGGLYTVTGLTLTNIALLNNTAQKWGGGAYVGGAVTLTGGLFQNNRTISTTIGAAGGGGLYVQNTLTLTGTQFMSNTSAGPFGGGGALVGGGATLNGGLFQNNRASYSGSFSYGGGLNAQSSLALTDTQFMKNAAPYGGGVRVAGTAILNGGQFQFNDANNSIGPGGGGLYAQGALTLRGTQFISNTGSLAAGGAGVYATNAVTATGTLFRFNRAAGKGGGLYAGGTAALTATQFIDNEAHDGGGMYHAASVLRVTNALFARNRAPAFGTGADLVLASSGSAQILHTTIADAGLTAREGIYVVAGTVGITDTIVVSHAIGIRQTGGAVYADYNLFYNNTTSKIGAIGGGTHDVNGDPVFVDPVNDDYHLGSDSAAVDTGIDVAIATDFDRDVRPQGIGFDMGYNEVLQQCSLSPDTDYAFSDPAVTLNFGAMGNVNCVAAVYFPHAAPHATGTVGHGVGADHFWQIAARDNLGQPATGFTASVTAPHGGFTNPLLCFYPGMLGGAGWDCTGTQTYNDSTVTRQAITHFSDWAVGNDVGPTAVTLLSVAARVDNHPIGFPVLWAALLGTVGLFLMWRRSR